jgi:hypothetical protein
MVDYDECDECRKLFEELRAALSEVEASPRLSKQLRDDAGFLLRLGTGEGADEAIGQFPFHTPQPAKYPKLAAVLQRATLHNYQTGHISARLRDGRFL